jgi:dTDP-4-amino-4,6-dideoxygalactose transaminase
VGAKFAVAVSSATAGLHLANLALDNPPGSKVVTSPMSFLSSANSIIYAGLVPAFVDIETATGNLSLEDLKKTIEENKISAVVPVHYAGLPCNMKDIYEICSSKNIYVIEDAAHALGATYSTGEKIGSCKYSDLTVFSFHPVKSITTGEGGIVTTNNEDLYLKLLKLRSHGIQKNQEHPKNSILSKTNGIPNVWYYEMDTLGFHYRITDIQAALGNSQMKKLDKFIKKRRKIAKRYDKLILKLDNISALQFNMRDRSANHLYPLKINFDKINISRNELMLKLRENGIITQVHYIPIPLQPYYQSLGYACDHLPNTLNYYFQALSLPIYPKLTKIKQRKVIQTLKKVMEIGN